MNTGLDGRVAIVTGAASGIGAATARALADEGCRIVAADLQPDVAAPDGIDEGSWTYVAADVSTTDAADRIVERAVDHFGRLDVLVTCAGIYETGSLTDVDHDVWDNVFAVNLRGSYLCARAAIGKMATAGFGRIILFGSVAAQTGGNVAAGPAYVSSKAGVMGLTRSLAHKAGPNGITVNCVCPGVIDTPMTAAVDKQAAAARTPLGRTGTPQDVAAVVVMLASAGAAFVTGAHIDVNGGLLMT